MKSLVAAKVEQAKLTYCALQVVQLEVVSHKVCIFVLCGLEFAAWCETNESTNAGMEWTIGNTNPQVAFLCDWLVAG